MTDGARSVHSPSLHVQSAPAASSGTLLSRLAGPNPTLATLADDAAAKHCYPRCAFTETQIAGAGD